MSTGVRRSAWRRRVASFAIGLSLCGAGPSFADESGASAWLPGQFASFAAAPGDPGFAFETIYFRRSASASASRSFRIGGSIATGLDLTEQYIFLTPSYTFHDPVLHGQLFVGATFAPGRADISVAGILTGPQGNSLSASRSDTMTGIGDINPLVSLKWTAGPHNFMAYSTGTVPVGMYDPIRLAGLGIGHWAIDWGLGYTFMSESGLEFSVTAGVTYNFMNPSTQYQSGTDSHIDWGLSYSPTEAFYFGAAGYFYDQLSGDSGPGAVLGPFQSRVGGVGPQVGCVFAIGRVQVDLNLRGYAEFAAENRPEGWNIWFTVGVSRGRSLAGK
jgi:hypothetical protein